MFAIKIITGRDASGTTYDEENVIRHRTRHDALYDACYLGKTTDLFDEETDRRIARVHADGGIDIVR